MLLSRARSIALLCAVAVTCTACGSAPSGAPETSASTPSAIDLVLLAACGDSGYAEWTAPANAVGYKCNGTSDGYDGFVKFFPNDAAEADFLNDLQCVGAVVAGPGWVVHQLGSATAKADLLMLNGAQSLC